MKVRDYFQAKSSRSVGSSSPLHVELIALGLPVPPVSGWMDIYGDMEIKGDLEASLIVALNRVISEEGPAKRESARRGLELLKYGEGVSHTWRDKCAGGVRMHVDHIKPRKFFPELP